MVIPDSELHLDGHAFLTYSYNIYLMSRNAVNITSNFNYQSELEEPGATNYLGVIMSASPGQYTYDSTGPLELSTQEVDELIKQIENYRNTPSLWHI